MLSSDGRHFYYGALQVEAADVRHNLRSFPELIRAASGQIAFGTNSYYDAVTGAFLGSYGFSTTVLFVSDDGQHLWAKNGSLAVHYDLKQSPPGVFANDVGVSSPIYAAQLVTPPTHGQLELHSDGSFQYVPNADFVGEDQFTYRADGVLGATASQSVTIHVTEPRDVAVDDAFSIRAGKILNINSADGLLKNDRPFLRSGATVELVTPPQHGVLTLQADGSFSYLAGVTFQGQETFRYRLVGGSEQSRPATVSLSVTMPDSSPLKLVNGELQLSWTVGNTASISPTADNSAVEVRIGSAVWLLLPEEYAAVTRLRVDGSSQSDRISLESVTTALFPNLTAVVINAGGGNDTVLGTSLSDQITLGRGFNEVHGNDGNDTVTGSTDTLATGSDTVFGDAGDDSLVAGVGNDSLDGGSGMDTLVGADGRDTLHGGVDGDRLRAGSASVLRVEEAGNVTLTPTEVRSNSNDTLEGAFAGAFVRTFQGNDRIDLSAWTTGGVTVISGVGNDTIVGSPQADVIDAFKGHDVVSGGGGDDTLQGGEGNDTLNGDDGNDRVSDSAGQNSMTGGAGRDTLVGGIANDSLFGGADNDSLNGGAGNDFLVGDDGQDTLVGADGQDVLQGGGGDDSLAGDEGSDSILGGAGADALLGGNGNDTLDAGADNDQVFGEAGDDSLQGGLGDDSLSGALGDDTFADLDTFAWSEQVSASSVLTLNSNGFEGLGRDSVTSQLSRFIMVGDQRNNVLDASTCVFAVEFVGGGGQDTFRSPDPALADATIDDAYDILTGQTLRIDAAHGVLANDSQMITAQHRPQVVTPPQYGQLTLRDDGSFDYVPVTNFLGHDSFVYRLGELTDLATVTLAIVKPRFVISGSQLEVRASQPSQIWFWSNGEDVIASMREVDDSESFEQSLSPAQRNAIQTLVIIGSEGADTIELQSLFSMDFPNLRKVSVQGGNGDDTIIGSELPDSIFGGDGADSIAAGLGNDTILGGNGDDELDGDEGNDSLEGGSGDDSLNGGDDDDTLIGQTGRDLLAVSPGKDVLQGSTTSFVVAAGGLNWVLANNRVSATFTVGRTRITVANTLRGRFGGAILLGDEDDNKLDASRFSYGNVIMFGDAGNDTLIGSSGTDLLSGESGNDLLDGRAGHDVLSGDEDNDTLRGNTGDDSLLGDEGDDSLDGAAGRDSLSGGLGDDTFRDGNGFYWFEDVAISPDMTLTTNGIEGFGTDKFLHRVLGLIVFGDERNNVIDASAYRGSVTIDGEEGDDTLIGSAFNDVIVGGEGNDNITGADGNDVLLGNNGNDLLNGARGADTLLGQTGHDSLSGGDDADALLGGEDDDTLHGQAATDTLVGGAGTNSLDVPAEARDQFSFNPTPLIASLEIPSAIQTLVDLFGDLSSEEDE